MASEEGLDHMELTVISIASRWISGTNFWIAIRRLTEMYTTQTSISALAVSEIV
jgi:hypothetical protein